LIESFEVGRNIQFKRDPNYWGKDLVVNRGMYNFERVRVEYFRDDTVRFEAFKTGAYDFTWEAYARKWVNDYNFPAIKDGRVKKYEVTDGQPMSPQALTYNLRRPMFQDRRVRQAMNYAFDFESLNRTIFYQQYTRLRSFFQKSDLEAKGLPGPDELALLEPMRDKIPAEVFTQEFEQPKTDGQGSLRENLLKARDLLTAAGWVVKDGQLVNGKTGQPFTFEIIETQQGLDAVVNPWLQNLQRLGIKGTLRFIDSTQFLNRANEFDYDVVSISFPLGLSPGNEQRDYWSSDSADRKGSRNLNGLKDPAVDALVEKIIGAVDRPALIAAARSLDRVLTWNYYRTLMYSTPVDRFAHWSKLQHPARVPLRGYGQWEGVVATWWADPAASKAKP
jgi:microcin C transport system substrate-binding protein